MNWIGRLLCWLGMHNEEILDDIHLDRIAWFAKKANVQGPVMGHDWRCTRCGASGRTWYD